MSTLDEIMEAPFSNREIREMMDDVRNSLTRIELQTTQHNGRMTKVERWQAYMTGAFSIIVAVVLPLLGWALWTLSNIQTDIHQAVDQALSAYDINQ